MQVDKKNTKHRTVLEYLQEIRIKGRCEIQASKKTYATDNARAGSGRAYYLDSVN